MGTGLEIEETAFSRRAPKYSSCFQLLLNYPPVFHLTTNVYSHTLSIVIRMLSEKILKAERGIPKEFLVYARSVPPPAL